jgi:hypothetical protein
MTENQAGQNTDADVEMTLSQIVHLEIEIRQVDLEIAARKKEIERLRVELADLVSDRLDLVRRLPIGHSLKSPRM